MPLKLYETERLIYVDNIDPCQYYVLRTEGVSPLPKKMLVKAKNVPLAVSIFKDHPRGIEAVKLEDLRYVDGDVWIPAKALEHKAESTKNSL